jgi:hypothetical protein
MDEQVYKTALTVGFRYKKSEKLLSFEDLDLVYSLSSKMSTDAKMLDAQADYQKLTFCKFDILCEALSQYSLLKYNHRDIVLVCKLLRRFCSMIKQNNDETYHLNFRQIYNIAMEDIYEGDYDASAPVTLLFRLLLSVVL